MPYKLLNRAKLSVKFLESNAATHHFLFGALAEFLDNSRDANAVNCKIFTENRDDLRGGYMLCFLDDGEGMDPITAKNLLTFGYSEKRNVDHFIGEYGNGLKSGSMRLGKDFILFTKKNSINTILFLSRTFFQDEHLEDEVIVPTPSFNGHTHQPWFDLNETNQDMNLQKHKEEMDLIYKYSPFKTENELFEQFKLIEGDSGTLLIIYNVHVSGNNKPDLDVTTDPKDFLISSSVHDNDIEPEKRSFRAYVSVLYTDPRMKIYIQGSKVRAQRFQYSLFTTYLYKYNAAKLFKEKAEKDIKDAEKTLDLLKQKKIELNSDAAHARENVASGPVINHEAQRISRLKQVDVVSINSQIEQMQKEIDRMKKNKNNPKIIDLIFGLNVRNRSQDGYFIYNGNRLIRMYEKPRKFHQNNQAPGIVGMVDIPFTVLKPGNNKQSFDDENTQKGLLSIFDEHLQQYIKDAQRDLRKDDLRDFWQLVGYSNDERDRVPNQELEFRRQRFYKSPIVLQCNNCRKWRMLRLHQSLMDKTFSDNWTCEDQTNSATKSCIEPEDLDRKITEGRLEPKRNEKDEPKDIPKDVPKNNNNLSSARSSLMSNSSISKSAIVNNKQTEDRSRASVRALSTNSDSDGSVYSNAPSGQRASLSTSILQRPNTSESSIQMSASILNPIRPSTSNSARTSLLSTDAQRIVSRAASEIDEEDERRRTNKRISEDVFSNNDDYMTNDDVINNQSDTNEQTSNGVCQQKNNKLHHKKKKIKRHGNVLGLDSSSDDDADYRPPRSAVSDVNNNSKNDKSSKSNSNSSSDPTVSGVRPVIKEEPEIVTEMDCHAANEVATDATCSSADLRSAWQRISDLEKRNAELDAKCKENERNMDNNKLRIFDLHKKIDEFKAKHECGEKRIKELEKELKEITTTYGRKIDESKELSQKLATLETSSDVLAENLKLLLEALRDPAEAPDQFTHLSIACLIKINVQEAFIKYRQRVEDQFQVQLNDKCNAYYKKARTELADKFNQKLARARDRCNCGSFDSQ